MNGVHLHLAISHIPVIGTGLALVLFVIGVMRKNDEFIKGGLLLFILLAISAVPTFFSGEAAEEVVERLPGALEPWIERHEGAAKAAMISEIIAGSLAILGWVLLRLKRRMPAWFAGFFLIVALAAQLLMARAANLGGQIQHPEIRTGGRG